MQKTVRIDQYLIPAAPGGLVWLCGPCADKWEKADKFIELVQAGGDRLSLRCIGCGRLNWQATVYGNPLEQPALEEVQPEVGFNGKPSVYVKYTGSMAGEFQHKGIVSDQRYAFSAGGPVQLVDLRDLSGLLRQGEPYEITRKPTELAPTHEKRLRPGASPPPSDPGAWAWPGLTEAPENPPPGPTPYNGG